MARGKRELRPEAERKDITGAQSFQLDLYFWLQTFTFILVTLILVFTFVGRLIGVDGSSMVPTLHDGDKLVLQSLGYTPAQGDVVVLNKHFDAAQAPIVKRVIAVGGQTVDIDYAAGTVTVDGVKLSEPYINEFMLAPTDSRMGNEHVVVPKGSIFVMGDNRNHSADSRDLTLGTVDERYVLGCARLVLFPFGNFGKI